MAQGRTERLEDSSLDAVGEVVPSDGGRAGWGRSVHLGPRNGAVPGGVSSAAVRKVAKELTARAALLQDQARLERDRAQRLQTRSAAATGRTGIDTLLQATHRSR